MKWRENRRSDIYLFMFAELRTYMRGPTTLIDFILFHSEILIPSADFIRFHYA